MGLSAGTRLGPYEILALLGAGGMGEVYRARDTRLERGVAIKVLPDEVATDPHALARFEHEAKAVAALSHPNILALYDVGESGGVHFAVTELLQGETLRLALADGPLPVRRALDIAVQIAEALAAAHENGIVHRDLKPENVFLCPDGRVKLLDFGLARHDASHRDPSDTRSPTVTGRSRPGSVTGTVAYMSPEQAKGNPVDYRSDQFSLGIVLYEMLSGKRPFRGDSAAETLTAIIREEPESLERVASLTPAPVRFLVERLLTKEPEGRYDSTRDLVRELTTWKLHPSGASGDIETPPLQAAGGKRRLTVAALGIALLAASAVGFFKWGEKAGRAPSPSFRRITLRRGAVASAHFTPDYQSVAYCASWEGNAREAFVQRLASADARPLGITGALVMGTAGAEVLIWREDLTLVRLPLEGGTPRELVKDVWDASWDRSGTRIAVERPIAGGTSSRLEFPVGNIVVERTSGEYFGKIAVSPDGRLLAFGLRPTPPDWSGDICVTDESRQRRTVLKGCGNLQHLVWTPDGKEIWFSTAAAGANYEIHAVTLSGRERLVARLPGELGIQDIAPDGRALATFGHRRSELRGRMAGDAAERNLSWTDGTIAPVLSPDGAQIVFQERSGGAETGATAYHWRLNNSTPTRLGDGSPWDVSPDWTTVLVGAGLGEKIEAKLVPIGAGETRTLPRGPIRSYVRGFWHPDGKRVFFLGADSEGKARLFVQEIAGGLPQPSLETIRFLISRDGRSFLAGDDGSFSLHPLDGGDARPLPFLKPEELPVEFTEDSNGLFLKVGRPFPIRVVRLDLQTGRRDPWLELTPSDLAGVSGGFFGRWDVSITPNGRFYAYGYRRNLNDLYVIEGLK